MQAPRPAPSVTHEMRPARQEITKRSSRVARCALAAGLAALAAGCGGVDEHGADKAGGATGPVVLSLAAAYGSDQPDAQYVTYFANQVAKLSGGRMRIRATFDASAVDVEERIARRVEAGDYDLGWIGARAWDELGVTSFQALQAPFLVSNYPLLERIVTGPLGLQMLAGLESRGMVGLALVPGLLRHPVGLTRPLVTLSDFAGARIRVIPSKVSDALIRALGGTPVHTLAGAVDERLVDGNESPAVTAPANGILTANVTLFAKALTLFAGKRSFGALTGEQRAILRQAAMRTVRHAASFPLAEALAFEGVLTRQFCKLPNRLGRVVFASPADLAALLRAAQPVYAELDRTVQTLAMIRQIRRLKASIPAPPPITVPASCLRSRSGPSSVGTQNPASILDGTYRWILTKAGAKAFGEPANGEGIGKVNVAVLRDGKWTFPAGDPGVDGTYTVVGNRVQFVWPQVSSVLVFTFVRGRDGTLHLKAVPPMDRGDAFVWSSAPWRRVGPPTRALR